MTKGKIPIKATKCEPRGGEGNFFFCVRYFCLSRVCLHKERVPRLTELPEQLSYPAWKSQFFIRSVTKHIGAFTCQTG